MHPGASSTITRALRSHRLHWADARAAALPSCEQVFRSDSPSATFAASQHAYATCTCARKKLGMSSSPLCCWFKTDHPCLHARITLSQLFVLPTAMTTCRSGPQDQHFRHRTSPLRTSYLLAGLTGSFGCKVTPKNDTDRQ